MNSIERFQNNYDSSKKSHKGKTISGKKERATKRYFKDTAAYTRRKQGKSRFDTFRRDEQPDPRDMWLEDIHFANFLGASHGVPYNPPNNYDYPININDCDLFRDKDDVISRTIIKDTDNGNNQFYAVENIIRQIECEPNTSTYFNYSNLFSYIPNDLRGDVYYKRCQADDGSEQPSKRICCENDIISRMEEGNLFNEEAQEEANFAAIVSYLKEQTEIAAMVEYMREQLARAEEIMASELYLATATNEH